MILIAGHVVPMNSKKLFDITKAPPTTAGIFMSVGLSYRPFSLSLSNTILDKKLANKKYLNNNLKTKTLKNLNDSFIKNKNCICYLSPFSMGLFTLKADFILCNKKINKLPYDCACCERVNDKCTPAKKPNRNKQKRLGFFYV